MPTQNNFTRSLFDRDEFTITYELVPGQGSGGWRVERLLKFAAEALHDGRIKALSITDNPGGHPALAPIAIGSEIKKIGMEPLLHFSLKDKNRNQVESHLFHYHREQFTNLLVLGGDFPKLNSWKLPLGNIALSPVHEFLCHHLFGGTRTFSVRFPVSIILDPPDISAFVDHSHITPPSRLDGHMMELSISRPKKFRTALLITTFFHNF